MTKPEYIKALEGAAHLLAAAAAMAAANCEESQVEKAATEGVGLANFAMSMHHTPRTAAAGRDVPLSNISGTVIDCIGRIHRFSAGFKKP